MQENKRIAFIIGGMGRGGAEKVISIISNHYAEIGWDVDIIMLLNNKVDYILHPNINLINLSYENKSRWKSLPYWIKYLRRYFKEKKPSVIISFAARINIISIIAKSFYKIPLIISERNDPKSDTRGHIAKLVVPLIYPKASRIVFQTEYAKKCFNKRIQNLGEIIYNPISVQCFAQEEKTNKIVTIGRLDAQKNQKMLINAFYNISKIYKDYILEIYGEGNLREELEKQIKNLGLDEKVFLKGNVLDIHHQIKNAKMFVLSSDFEGLSNALLEAMVMGLPCISTECAGATEIIKDGENGLLISIDNEEELIMAIMKYIKDQSLAKRLAENAKNIQGLVAKEKIIKKWQEAINQVIWEENNENC